MKKLFLTLVLFPYLTFAQSEHYGELIITLINEGSSWDVTFVLSAIGAQWDENFELTEDYDYVSSNINSSPPSQTVAYFDHVMDGWQGGLPMFAFGLYKIIALENGIGQAHFYMDWRTSDVEPFGDVYFKYDVGNKRFRDNDNTQTLNKSYQTLWDILGQHGSTLETSGFEDYWDNCLVSILDPDDYVKLVWGTYPNDPPLIGTIIGYRIYRSESQPNNFSLIDEVNANASFYVDEEVNLSTLLEDVYYKVTCIAEDSEQDRIIESSPTNIIQVTNTPTFGKIKDQNKEIIKSFNLDQNFPNPFNPTTTIIYSLPVTTHTTLKIFDILGNEIFTPVDGIKEAGTHRIEFDASNLTSGIYFYQLRAGIYSQTKKLILQK